MTTTFDGTNLPHIRNDINEALATVAAKYGITLELGNMRYSEGQFTTKLTATAAETKSDAARVNWETHAIRFGLENSMFGKRFSASGKTLEICGIKPRNRKYPVLARSTNGEVYKLSVRQLLSAMNYS